MEELVDELKQQCGTQEQFETTLKLFYTYINNIHVNNTVVKYRTIKIKNEKFSKNIWKYDSCKTLLLMSQFMLMEETGNEYLCLPNEISVSLIHGILQNRMKEENMVVKSPTKKNIDSSRLKLNTSGASAFEEELKADLTLLSYLAEMGFPRGASMKALIATNNKGVQPAMDWLDEHPESLVITDGEQSTSKADVAMETTNTNALMGIMQNPTEEVAVSRLQKASSEKHKYQEKLRLESIKKAKIAKQEDKLAKENLMKNMQSERQKAKEKFEMEKRIRHASDHTHEEESITSRDEEDKIKIKIKMLDGEMKIWYADMGASVKDLYSYVAECSVGSTDYVIVQPHPHVILENEDTATLKERGLFPTAAVVVQQVKHDAQYEVTHEAAPTDDVMTEDTQ